jgi:SAM-dependent methyltransferase
MSTSYDLVPYPGGAHRQTHPANSSAIATVLGLSPKRSGFRVLELGCGHGDNLTPMAYNLPDCEFVGIDLAPTAIERGRADVARLGLKNVRLEALDLMQFPQDAGQFDYIISHGLFSWVPDFVREKILAVYAAHLAPHGVGFISFNANPGGHLRDMLRQMMRRHTAGIDNPAQKIAAARRFLDSLVEEGKTGADVDSFSTMMRAEVERTRKTHDSVFYHDDLAEENGYFYFEDFAKRAAGHGLAFLSEAEFFQSTEDYYSGTRLELLEACGDDVIKHEQLRDYFKCRRFRQPLLVRADAPIERARDPKRILDLYATARVVPAERKLNLAPGAEVKFGKPGGASFATNHSLSKAMFAILADRWPQAVRVADLIAGAAANLAKAGAGAQYTGPAEQEQALEFLFDTYRANFTEITGVATPLSRRPAEKPRASAIARAQIVQGISATTLTHEDIRFETEIPRKLLALLDGTRDRAALLAELAPLHPEMNARDLEELLGEMGRMGFLHDEEAATA